MKKNANENYGPGPSFRAAESDGWRHTLGWRTRREAGGWALQRWNGEDWEAVEVGLPSYAAARQRAAR